MQEKRGQFAQVGRGQLQEGKGEWPEGHRIPILF